MQTVPESPTAVDCPRSPEQDENVMPPHRYSISPGAYSPYGARDNRRTSQLYSPFRMPGDLPILQAHAHALWKRTPELQVAC